MTLPTPVPLWLKNTLIHGSIVALIAVMIFKVSHQSGLATSAHDLCTLQCETTGECRACQIVAQASSDSGGSPPPPPPTTVNLTELRSGITFISMFETILAPYHANWLLKDFIAPA